MHLVIGGGVAGLTAAYELAKVGQRVTLVEASDRLGGKLRSATIAGVTVDVGAEAMLARRPEGVELAGELGLDIVHNTAASSRLWVGGELKPLPRTLMGVPFDFADPDVLAVVPARAETFDRLPAGFDGDVSVGDLVDARLGRDVTDLLVDPLLGGVNAGSARDISARAAVPQLWALARQGSLLEAAASVPRVDGPVFASIRGGMWRLAEALRAAIEERGGVVRLGEPVPWEQDLSGFEGVVDTRPGKLTGTPYANVIVFSLAFRAVDLAGARLHGEAYLDGSCSGFLVPETEGRDLDIKASTFSFAKWDWIREAGERAGDVRHLRVSFGRNVLDDGPPFDWSDQALTRAALADLKTTTGLDARPVDVHVQRWWDALPQYRVGHVDRVADLRAEVAAEAPPTAVAGADLDGVGIPAVIASARRAVAELLE